LTGAAQHWPPCWRRGGLCGAAGGTGPSSAAAGLSTAASLGATRAALVVIGDEVLSGSVVDSNTPWLAKLLHSRGVDLVRVLYIPDSPADIKEAVLDCRARVGPGGSVFTSGGIGPTHDDVT
ncbi:FAD synthase, partial [Tetrabaena socialis]